MTDPTSPSQGGSPKPESTQGHGNPVETAQPPPREQLYWVSFTEDTIRDALKALNSFSPDLVDLFAGLTHSLFSVLVQTANGQEQAFLFERDPQVLRLLCHLFVHPYIDEDPLRLPILLQYASMLRRQDPRPWGSLGLLQPQAEAEAQFLDQLAQHSNIARNSGFPVQYAHHDAATFMRREKIEMGLLPAVLRGLEVRTGCVTCSDTRPWEKKTCRWPDRATHSIIVQDLVYISMALDTVTTAKGFPMWPPINLGFVEFLSAHNSSSIESFLEIRARYFDVINRIWQRARNDGIKSNTNRSEKLQVGMSPHVALDKSDDMKRALSLLDEKLSQLSTSQQRGLVTTQSLIDGLGKRIDSLKHGVRELKPPRGSDGLLSLASGETESGEDSDAISGARVSKGKDFIIFQRRKPTWRRKTSKL